MVGYVNLLTGTAFCLPVTEMEHALRLSIVQRKRKEKDK